MRFWNRVQTFIYEGKNEIETFGEHPRKTQFIKIAPKFRGYSYFQSIYNKLFVIHNFIIIISHTVGIKERNHIAHTLYYFFVPLFRCIVIEGHNIVL